MRVHPACLIAASLIAPVVIAPQFPALPSMSEIARLLPSEFPVHDVFGEAAPRPAGPIVGPRDPAQPVLPVAGSRTGVAGAARIVITNDTGWRGFWAEHRPADLFPPRIDFSQERVVAVLLGARPNACWAVDVVNVTQDAIFDVTRVQVQVTAPGAGAVCASVIVRPFALATVPADGTAVVFSETVVPVEAGRRT